MKTKAMHCFFKPTYIIVIWASFDDLIYYPVSKINQQLLRYCIEIGNVKE